MVDAFVTGGSGFIGRALVAELRARGRAVVAPGRAELDLGDRTAVEASIAAAEPSVVFHLASAGVFSRDPTDRAIEHSEVEMARNVAEGCLPGSRLIIAGSMAEYGQSGRLSETLPCTPRTPYAKGKLRAGEAAAEIARRKGLHLTRARIFGAYGPGEDARRLFPSVTIALRAGASIALSDGLQRRDFVHVADVASALVDLAEGQGSPGIINIGTGQALEVRAVLLRLAEELGVPGTSLKFGARDRAINDEHVSEADTELLHTTIGRELAQRLAGPDPILPHLGVELHGMNGSAANAT